MGLAELQAAAARLSTDAEARRLWEADPVKFSGEFSLSAAEAESLHRIAPSVARFARSLRQKRRQEAAQALPLTRALLGADFEALFDSFTNAATIAADPMLDALAFLRWLQRQRQPTETRNRARYEEAALAFRRGNRRLGIGLFRTRSWWRYFVGLWWRARPGGPARQRVWPRRSL